MYFVATKLLRLFRQTKRTMGKQERERRTEHLPRVRLYPSELIRLVADATARGMGKKVGAYIRVKLFGGTMSAPLPGMPMDQVLQNMVDLRRFALPETTVEERKRLYQAILKRHLDVATQAP